jgi:Tc5 transposase DNA-binding domain
LEAHLKSWINAQQADGKQATSAFQEARKPAVLMDLANFKGSPKWIYNFMKRNHIVHRAVTFVGQHLPADWMESKDSFVEFCDTKQERIVAGSNQKYERGSCHVRHAIKFHVRSKKHFAL